MGVLEAGSAHPQRLEQFALDELAERLPGARGDELAEDEVAEIAVGTLCLPGGTGAAGAGAAGRREKRPAIGRRRACWPHPADRRGVRQPGGVRQQVTCRDQRPGPVQDAHLGNVLDDRRVQIHSAPVREHHRGRRGHDLRHREPQERRLGGDRPPGADIGQAAGDELRRAVGGHDSGGQAGRSPARGGVLDQRLPGARRRGAAVPGHCRAPLSAAVTRNTGYCAAIGSNASTGARRSTGMCALAPGARWR